MRLTLPLVLTALLAGPMHDDDTKRSIAAIKKVDGKVILDTSAPGHPVVEVNL